MYPEPIPELHTAGRFHIPTTENSAPQSEREPSQERDVAPSDYVGTPEPTGPLLVNQLVDGLSSEDRARALMALWRDLSSRKRELSELAAVTSQTDASGNLDLPAYQVPLGFEATITRVNIEAGSGNFTPAAPFAAANAWAALIRGLRFGTGSILDFAPASAGGPIFPGVWTDSATQAIRLRGGEWVTLHVVGTVTLATTPVYCRLQGWISEL
jgi:hypothetical protein